MCEMWWRIGEGMINFLSKDVFLEESAGKRKILLVMDENIMDFEKRMLCDSDCPFTLPMHFISDEESMKAYYDFTGYIQLEEYIKRNKVSDSTNRESQNTIFDALDVLNKILECLKGMEEYLLFTERISIHTDLVFIDLCNKHLAFAFYPNEMIGKPLQSRIIDIVDSINGLYGDVEAEQFLEKFKDYIYKRNPGLDGMIGNLGILQREASYIYWNTKNFRGVEEPESNDGREYTDKPLTVLKKSPSMKIIVIQALIGAALLAVFLSGILEIVKLAGLTVITAAVDLMIIRMLRLKYRFSGIPSI